MWSCGVARRLAPAPEATVQESGGHAARCSEEFVTTPDETSNSAFTSTYVRESALSHNSLVPGSGRTAASAPPCLLQPPLPASRRLRLRRASFEYCCNLFFDFHLPRRFLGEHVQFCIRQSKIAADCQKQYPDVWTTGETCETPRIFRSGKLGKMGFNTAFKSLIARAFSSVAFLCTPAGIAVAVFAAIGCFDSARNAESTNKGSYARGMDSNGTISGNRDILRPKGMAPLWMFHAADDRGTGDGQSLHGREGGRCVILASRGDAREACLPGR